MPSRLGDGTVLVPKVAQSFDGMQWDVETWDSAAWGGAQLLFVESRKVLPDTIFAPTVPLGPPTPDIFVESFTIDGSTTVTLAQPADLDHAFVKMLAGGSRPSGAGPTNSTSNSGPNTASEVHLTDENTLTSSSGSTSRSIGQVWRYDGEAGGVNEFVTRWRGSVAVTTSGEVVTDLSAAGIVDRNRCVPMLGGIRHTSSSTNEWDQACPDVWIDANGDLVVVTKDSGQAGTATIYIEVVEFTGSNWEVGHAHFTSYDTSPQTVTMNTDSTGTGGSTFDVTDWGTAWIVAHMRGDAGGETGLSDTLAIFRPGGATTTCEIDVHQDSNARNDGEAHAHIIRHPDIGVHRYVNENWTEGNGAYTTIPWPSGAPTDVDTDHIGIEWFVDTNGTGTAHARGAVGPEITSSNAARGWVHRSGNNVAIAFGVIDLSGIESAKPMP